VPPCWPEHRLKHESPLFKPSHESRSRRQTPSLPSSDVPNPEKTSAALPGHKKPMSEAAHAPKSRARPPRSLTPALLAPTSPAAKRILVGQLPQRHIKESGLHTPTACPWAWPFRPAAIGAHLRVDHLCRKGRTRCRAPTMVERRGRDRRGCIGRAWRESQRFQALWTHLGRPWCRQTSFSAEVPTVQLSRRNAGTAGLTDIDRKNFHIRG